MFYKGQTYIFDTIGHAGKYYFEDEYALDNVEQELAPFIDEINEAIHGFILMENPRHPFWNYPTLQALQHNLFDKQDMPASINLKFFCWYFLTEQQYIDDTFPQYLLMNELFLRYEHEFLSEPLYLFITGWMLVQSPQLLEARAGEGKERLQQAYVLAPNEPLYKWAVSKELNLSREETRALAAQVTAAAFDGLGPFIKDYFMDIVQGDAQIK